MAGRKLVTLVPSFGHVERSFTMQAHAAAQRYLKHPLAQTGTESERPTKYNQGMRKGSSEDHGILYFLLMWVWELP